MVGASKGWVRDHASGRKQPRLQSIKLGPRKARDYGNFARRTSSNFYSTRAAGSDSRRTTNPFRGMAEREGFEPPIPVKVYTLSRRAPSATRPSLRALLLHPYFIRTLFASSLYAYRNGLSPAQRSRPSPGCDWLLHSPCGSLPDQSSECRRSALFCRRCARVVPAFR
jgi:hypothetical protein